MDLTKFTNQQLKECLQRFQDRSSGTKQELIVRLQKHNPEAAQKILEQFATPKPADKSVNLLDVSIDENNGKDSIAALSGDVAILKNTVAQLVKQLQNVLTGPNLTQGSTVVPASAQASGISEGAPANGTLIQPAASVGSVLSGNAGAQQIVGRVQSGTAAAQPVQGASGSAPMKGESGSAPVQSASYMGGAPMPGASGGLPVQSALYMNNSSSIVHGQCTDATNAVYGQYTVATRIVCSRKCNHAAGSRGVSANNSNKFRCS